LPAAGCDAAAELAVDAEAEVADRFQRLPDPARRKLHLRVAQGMPQQKHQRRHEGLRSDTPFGAVSDRTHADPILQRTETALHVVQFFLLSHRVLGRHRRPVGLDQVLAFVLRLARQVNRVFKATQLAVRAIQYSSKPGENALELFGGSGSTLIACEQTGRRCFAMEIDELYCDVIVKRWQEFTGRKAERKGVAEVPA